MMEPLYISFYTPAYAMSAGELQHTLDAFSLESAITPLDSPRHNWMAGVQHKPCFVWEMMNRYPDRPLVWVDADARIRRRPELFDAWALDLKRGRGDRVPDFAAHWLGGMELLSGTLWFSPTAPARLLALRWMHLQARRRDLVDQVVLEKLLPGAPPKGPSWLKIGNLPPSYTAIFDHPNMCDKRDWVISHHQYSRQFRNAV